MAQNFIFCSVLWIVVAVIAVGQSQVLTTLTPATSTMAPVTTAAPTPAPDPCDKNPCGRGSTCEARGQTFICLCLPGDYYSNITKCCDSVKVFPGLLELPEIVYENSMSEKASPAFKSAADIITEELDKSLRSDPTYRGCIVLELRPVSNIRLRSGIGISASVDLIYSAESTVTTSQVQQMVKTATECSNCSLAGATFEEVDLCQRNPCDVATTSCSSKDGTVSCTCLDGYVPSDFCTRTCLAAPSNTTAPGTTAAPTPVPGPCSNNPCGPGSTCEARGQTFICLCLPGDYYNSVNKRCESAKVFPGQLELPEIDYENSMSDKASPAFKRAADNITEELFKSLNPLDSNYVGCIVLELRPVSNIRLRVNQHVNASVELIYSAESTVTTSQVLQMVKTATECTDCKLKGATFAEVDLCQSNTCDGTTTSCSSLDGTVTCTCLDGYVPSDFCTRICLATPGTTVAPTPAPGTTVSPTPAPGTTVAPTPAPFTTVSPTPAPDPCDKNPCGGGSTCETRANQTFICLCLPGDYYSNTSTSCKRAKVFPGQLQLPQIVYENSMSDKASPAFKRAADIITEELDKSLRSDPTYLGCIVLELRPVSNTRLRMNQHVNASVELIYSAESNVTTSQVLQMVKTATNCTDCKLAGATFAEVDLCQRNPCDVYTTTSCSSHDGTLSCTCLDGYIQTDTSYRKCIACKFGYSGFNCNETWQLILVIVGSVLGGLLLILLTIVSVWCLKKSSKKNKASDIGLIPAKGPVANKRPDNRNSQLEDNHYDEISPYAVYERTSK